MNTYICIYDPLVWHGACAHLSASLLSPLQPLHPGHSLALPLPLYLSLSFALSFSLSICVSIALFCLYLSQPSTPRTQVALFQPSSCGFWDGWKR